MSMTTVCPDCGEDIQKRAKSCPCGWRPSAQNANYHAKLEARRQDPNQTQVLICRGDHAPGQHASSEIVWYPGDTDGPRACAWQTRGRRCRMVGTEDAYCPFHRVCLNNGWDHPTMQDFAEWLSESERWQGDLGFLWARLTGEVWIIPVENGPSDFSEPVGGPKTKAEAMDLAGALARGVQRGKPGVVAELRKMAKHYQANSAFYNREADRMEREYETEKAEKEAVEETGKAVAPAGLGAEERT